MNPSKNPGIAAVLSFFWTGLGQIYNGRIGKGIFFIFMQFVNALLMFALIGFITFPLFWIWGMVDAYGEAEEINLRKCKKVDEPIPLIAAPVPQSQIIVGHKSKDRFSMVLNLLLIGALIFYLMYPSYVLKHRYQVIQFFSTKK